MQLEASTEVMINELSYISIPSSSIAIPFNNYQEKFIDKRLTVKVCVKFGINVFN